VSKLKKYLEAAEMTQAEFATAVGVSQPTVSDWVNGEMSPSLGNLVALSEITGIGLDELVRDFARDVA
jgi:transcriptional regulator with XRE-family HTH domain